MSIDMNPQVTKRQRLLVQASFEEIILEIDSFVDMFYEKLFVLDPSLMPLFSGDMQRQVRKVVQILLFAVNDIGNMYVLVPQIQEVAKRHVGYKVKEEYFVIVGQALIQSVGERLGPAFTNELEEAWQTIYNTLATLMIEHMKSQGRHE